MSKTAQPKVAEPKPVTLDDLLLDAGKATEAQLAQFHQQLGAKSMLEALKRDGYVIVKETGTE